MSLVLFTSKNKGKDQEKTEKTKRPFARKIWKYMDNCFDAHDDSQPDNLQQPDEVSAWPSFFSVTNKLTHLHAAAASK